MNLTILSLTNGKNTLDIIGSSDKNPSSSEMPLPPSGDVLFVFDNAKMIGKIWSIKPLDKIKSYVITAVAAMELDAEMKFECEIYHPAEWFTRAKGSQIGGGFG